LRRFPWILLLAGFCIGCGRAHPRGRSALTALTLTALAFAALHQLCTPMLDRLEHLPGPQAGIYTASKFAVRGLTECLRFNLAPYGIGVSLVCPALTRTKAWDSALRRPARFAASGFAPPDRAELARFGEAFEAGMDPLEVGQKTLAGMRENRASSVSSR